MDKVDVNNITLAQAMQIQIISADAQNGTRLAVVEHKAGQAAVKHIVQAGQKITVIVDGVTLKGSQVIGSKKLKLLKSDKNLIIETEDGEAQIVELTDFYNEEDAFLTGEEWSMADGSQLKNVDDGVMFVAEGASAATGSALVGLGGSAVAGGVAAGGVLAIGAATGSAATASDTKTAAIPATPSVTTNVNAAPLMGDGIVMTPVGAGVDRAYGMTMQSDGKILVAGESNNGSNADFALTRYNANGSLDTSFGTGGIVTTRIGSADDLGRAVVLQADGKIVVVGESMIAGNFDIALTRYNSDGSLDSSFGGGDGIVTTAVGTGHDHGQSVTVQADGKLLVAGYSRTANNFDFTLVRYNTDGTTDTSFGGGDGIVTTAIGTGNDIGRSITLQADGKILVAGHGVVGGNQDYVLVRYNADGTLDTGFSDDGIVVTVIGPADDRAYSVNVQTDGRILLAGLSNNDFSLVRYNSNGSLDTSFGGDGIVTTDIAGGTDLGRAMTILSDGKILVAGQVGTLSSSDFALIRYNNDGTLDNSFGGGDGIVITATSAGTDIAQAMCVQPDGKIVVSGYARNGLNDDFILVRYKSDGTLDITFDSQPGQGPTFTKGGAAIALNPNVQVFDEELSAANSFSGATLNLVRQGGANSDDVLVFDGINVTTSGTNVLVGGVEVGTFLQAGGQLDITFGANATQALVITLAQNIVYSNSSDTPPATVTLNWALNDGNTGTQGTGGNLTASMSTVVHITVTAPVVIDLNRDGSLGYSQVVMDVDGDGNLDQTAWAGAQDGVLVWDKYADGLVRDSSQYAFTQYGGNTDLEGLAIGFDSNGDDRFNALDAKFGEFKVWQDADQDGVSDAGEVRSLAGWGLTEINLTSDGVVRTPAPGVKEAGQTTATATDGTSVLVGDVAFAYSNLAYSAHQGWINQQLQVISA